MNKEQQEFWDDRSPEGIENVVWPVLKGLHLSANPSDWKAADIIEKTLDIEFNYTRFKKEVFPYLNPDDPAQV